MKNFKTIPENLIPQLMNALSSNDTYDLFNCLITMKFDINDRINNIGETLLHRVVWDGKIDHIRLILDFHANPNLKDYRGYAPLHISARWGYFGIVETLLQHGADPLQKNDSGESTYDIVNKYLLDWDAHQKKTKELVNNHPLIKAEKNKPTAPSKSLTQRFAQSKEADQKLEQKIQPKKDDKLQDFLKQFNGLEEDFMCPLSLEIMNDPVITPAGITYERKHAQEWIKRNGTEPTVKTPMTVDQLIPNRSLKKAIDSYRSLQEKSKELVDASAAKPNNSRNG